MACLCQENTLSQLTRSQSLSPKRNKRFFGHRRSLSEGGDFVSQLKGRVELTKDKINRDKIKWPCSGPLLVQLYSIYFGSSVLRPRALKV